MKTTIVFIALLALTACETRPRDAASNPPTDVNAIRGASGPSASQPNNVVTRMVAQDIAAMKSAQAAADTANKKIAADQHRVDSNGQN